MRTFIAARLRHVPDYVHHATLVGFFLHLGIRVVSPRRSVFVANTVADPHSARNEVRRHVARTTGTDEPLHLPATRAHGVRRGHDLEQVCLLHAARDAVPVVVRNVTPSLT